MENILLHLWPVLKSGFYFGFTALLVALLVTPIQFLKIRRQETGLGYMEIFRTQLSQYGWRRFYIAAIPYSLINFYVSAAFGISEYICLVLLSPYGHYSTVVGLIVRTIAAGVAETSTTVRTEIKEIARNKDELLQIRPSVSQVLVPAFTRNSLAWLGSIMTLFVIDAKGLTLLPSTLLSLVFGVICGFLTIPLDILTTRNCGARKTVSIFEYIRTVFSGNPSSLFNGSLARVIQMAFYTAAATLTEVAIKHFDL